MSWEVTITQPTITWLERTVVIRGETARACGGERCFTLAYRAIDLVSMRDDWTVLVKARDTMLLVSIDNGLPRTAVNDIDWHKVTGAEQQAAIARAREFYVELSRRMEKAT